MSARRLGAVLAVAAVAFVLVGGLLASGSDARRHRVRTTAPASAAPASNRTDPRLRAIGFRSQARLDDHYAKHGREFGSISKAQYLAMAQDLRDAPLSRIVVEATKADGSLSRFNRSTGGFLAFNRDLTIRTFFRPRDGEAYFRRAAGTRH